MSFLKVFHVRWGDMDFNAHMKNTAYLDISADVRMMCFAESGFPMSEFERLRIGPVILRDELDYYRELHLLEPLTVDLALAGLSDDGSRFRFRNRFFRPDGKQAATVTSLGGWLDLDRRKLAAPPEPLKELLDRLDRSDDFQCWTQASADRFSGSTG